MDSKTLVRRLMGNKRGMRPTPVYVHPQLDKVGPASLTALLQKKRTK